jgi:hypothetical protein
VRRTAWAPWFSPGKCQSRGPLAYPLPRAHPRSAHLEGNGVGVWVLEVERLGDLLLEGPCSIQSGCAWQVFHRSLRLKPSSTGSSSTDIAGARVVVWCCESRVGNQVSRVQRVPEE